MKKLDNFSNCLSVLKKANFALAQEDEIYRTGVIGQFNLTFELAWQALRDVLRLYGIDDFTLGLPREVLKIGCRSGFLRDDSVWLSMLKKRNESTHIYDEEAIDATIRVIRDDFLPAFGALEETLRKKLDEAEGNWTRAI